MAVIDYKGYRVMVTPILPIDKTTIVYGSNDGGKTVHTDIPEVNEVVKEMASRLRLKEHKVGKDPQTAKMLYTPGCYSSLSFSNLLFLLILSLTGNFQVHKGKDDRYYAVGFNRIFPPEVSNYPINFASFVDIPLILRLLAWIPTSLVQ